MSATILLLAADPSTLTILAQRLGDVAGVRVIEERRRRPRQHPGRTVRAYRPRTPKIIFDNLLRMR